MQRMNRDGVVVSGSSNLNNCFLKFVLQVQDFGCGIPASKLDSIFVNFGNLVEHQNVNPSGRGLGLSICKLIIEKMGGSVTVESQEGVGSTFNLTFRTVARVSANDLHELSKNEPLASNRFPDSSYRSYKIEVEQLVMQSLEFGENRQAKMLPRVLLVNDEPFLLLGFSQQLNKHF